MQVGFEPNTFADKMIELESALQYQESIALIWALNDHYRAGIDHYMEKQPKKAKFIQKKMTALLANPDNLRILERQAHKKQNNKYNPLDCKDTQNSKQDTEIRQLKLNSSKLNQQIHKFNTVADSCIQNIVQSSDKAANKIEKLKNMDINRQKQKLEDRIMLKRVKSQDKIKRVLSQKNLDAPVFNNINVNIREANKQTMVIVEPIVSPRKKLQ